MSHPSACQSPSPDGWTEIIRPHVGLLSLPFGEVWRYRDLMWMFIVRDFVTVYKQTVLGPLWFFIRPLLTTIVFTVIFGMVAGIATDDIPKPLFYLSGLILWNYFADCFRSASGTFRGNSKLFGKVYFPRLITPLAMVVSRVLKLAIQLALFIVIYLIYAYQGVALRPNSGIFLLPLLVILMACMSLGLGFIVASMTTKYRDLSFLLGFGVQLWMYATPIIYPLSLVSKQYRWAMALNPLTSLLEAFRWGAFGHSTFEWTYLLYSAAFTGVVLLLGIIVFNKIEKNFMDTV